MQKDKEKSQSPDENVVKAHEEAEKDIKKDPDLTPKPDPGTDLDEGELAKLEGQE